jgi:hypothetical protein
MRQPLGQGRDGILCAGGEMSGRTLGLSTKAERTLVPPLQKLYRRSGDSHPSLRPRGPRALLSLRIVFRLLLSVIREKLTDDVVVWVDGGSEHDGWNRPSPIATPKAQLDGYQGDSSCSGCGRGVYS